SYTLKAFLRRRDICAKSLAFFDRQDAYQYADARLKDTWNGKKITPPTLRREVNILQDIWERARTHWGLSNLSNPWRGMKIKGSMLRRKRRLKEGELAQIEAQFSTLRADNRYYVPLAIFLAIETGMRLQEIFNLTWDDVDIDKRRIEIRKSK